MSDIQRYDMTNDYGCESMEESVDGNWVDYDDHIAKIKTLEADLKKVSEYYFKESTTTAEVLEVEEILEAQI